MKDRIQDLRNLVQRKAAGYFFMNAQYKWMDDDIKDDIVELEILNRLHTYLHHKKELFVQPSCTNTNEFRVMVLQLDDRKAPARVVYMDPKKTYSTYNDALYYGIVNALETLK